MTADTGPTDARPYAGDSSIRVAAEAVSYGYAGSDDREPVLREASLAAEPGEVVALVGPSGTGKTTLLRLFALFDPPDRVHRALETVGMAGMADRDTRSLSAGEAQRVAVARSLATDPDVLLLDEPTANLDPRNTAAIEDAVTDARDRGIGIAIATHDMAQARRVADRSAVMLDGTVIERGPTERVFDDPNDERARAFVRGELVY